MIETRCQCGAVGRFDRREGAIAEGWTRLSLPDGSTLGWFCPREASATIREAEQNGAGLGLVREGPIREG